MPLVGKRIATTTDNFRKMVENDYLLVDKSLMIKEFMDSTDDATLITRPRRFGKTLNLSMLQHFFAAEVNGKSTQGLFDKFAVAAVDDGQFLQKHQGKYPVIFVTFKDIKESSYQAAVKQINVLIQELYSEHENLLSSDEVSATDKLKFQKYLDGSANNEELQQALKFLSTFLYKACGKKVIILIDEYDTPLTSAYEHRFLGSLSDFLRNMFSAVLKTNPYLEKGLMTGILRVSKNSMLSGLSNLKIYTVINKAYHSHFGFTEGEITELIKATGITQSMDEIKGYYNGYKISGAVIYNPWSTMQFFDSKELAPYWVLTSNDKLLKDILLNSSDETKKLLNDLMQGKVIEGEIDANLRYEDLIEKPAALWTLLLFCGYLTTDSKEQKGSRFICQLKIPNAEVLGQYTEVFSDWLKEAMGAKYHSFLSSLTEGNVEKFTEDLGGFLMRSLSFKDVAGNTKNSERFYHGFFVGLTASLQEKYDYASNKESGLGLYDVGLVPISRSNPVGVVLEFKKATSDENMELGAKKALHQIDEMHYETSFKAHSHVKKLLKVGLVFCDKSVRSAYKKTDLELQKETGVSLSQEYHLEDDIYDSDDNSQAVVSKMDTEKKSKKTTKKRVIKESDDVSSERSQAEKPPEAKRPKKREIDGQVASKNLGIISTGMQEATSSLSGYAGHGMFGAAANTGSNPVVSPTTITHVSNSSNDDVEMDDSAEHKNTP